MTPEVLLSCSEGRGRAAYLEMAGGTRHRVGWAVTTGHRRWGGDSGWRLGGQDIFREEGLLLAWELPCSGEPGACQGREETELAGAGQ